MPYCNGVVEFYVENSNYEVRHNSCCYKSLIDALNDQKGKIYTELSRT